MRILFLSTWYPFPPDNGARIRVYYLLRSLAAVHDVTLLSFLAGRTADAGGDRSPTWCPQVARLAIDPYVYNDKGTLRRFISPAPLFVREIPAMSDLVRSTRAKQEFDVVIASFELTAVYALAGPPGVVKILEEHNSLSRWMQERIVVAKTPLGKARSWVSWHKARRYEARLFRRFDLVTMVSEQDRRDAEKRAGGRTPVQVVPNGVDCESNQPGKYRKGRGQLVFNGSLQYSPNFEAMRYFLTSVYPAIRAKLPSASLTITGSIEGVDLGGLSLDESVHLPGRVEDVRPIVGGAGACVVPIRQGGGTRLKILEAMALGTPVVTTSKGAEGLDVVSGEHLLIADTPQDFAAVTVRLLQEPDLGERLARAAREHVEDHYDWERIGAGFVSLVEETVERRHRGDA